MENSQIADIFEEIADLLELKDGNRFRIRSYRAAAQTVRNLSRRLEDIADTEDLTELPDIGKSTAGKIHQILQTGTCERLESLRAELPESLLEIMQVPQMGPRKTIQLHRELGIDTIEELRHACEGQAVRKLEGFGEKMEAKILAGIETLEHSRGRFPYREAAEQLKSLTHYLNACGVVRRWEIAGSYRRRKETVGDLDILLTAKDRPEAVDALVNYDQVDSILNRGEERVSVVLKGGLQVDFRFFEESNFGAALIYFTGSKQHNIKLRQRAQEHDWKLNEYGLFKDDDLLAGRSEEAVYHRLSLPWIAPELRENRGEIAAAEEDRLPDLVELGDIKGDLHSHTTATDGKRSVREMAAAARERGYQYLAITDHSKQVRVAGGLDDDQLRRHADEIRTVNEELEDFWLLAGVEVDILKSGKLDLSESLLEELDWVIASTHYYLDLDKEKMTDRLLAAISSGVVDCLAHPLARMRGKREPIQFDLDTVLGACRDHGVRLEINAQPDRMDLPDTYCREVKQGGVGLVIGTDAHRLGDFDLMELGVYQARRGWLEAADILNTRNLKKLKELL